ncbi:site-specific recombinase XerD [Halovivax ruber XH-70]|uniref:Site-specific recombinase XerD n=1 Tax=Halovivax ruber (strain DSM 18193 / JCM 13892 / XH-70) TaxID=797302 RepID=L0IAX3_HALRX|nr:tyrosine-type recombinase/integrase [Halovivax ruber]AGB15968.1 site-specific recombinase XerD [Halovivax ruber XH-70]
MSETMADPIEYFLEDVTHHGRNVRTHEAYERVLGEYEQFLDEERGTSPTNATYRDCMAWVHDIRSQHAESTIATYASYLNRFYSYLERVGRHDENPMALVVEEMDESIETSPARRDISISEMQRFVSQIAHPLHRTIVSTLLKTGLRSGELCNLDLRDVNLAGNQYWTPRPQIEGQDGSLYVSPDHTYGEQSGGTMRTASNKRKRETVVPIDDELETELRRWLAIRPDTVEPVEPVFVSTEDRWGKRLTPDHVHHIVTDRTRREGWYRTGGGARENVTPHYFRHFFTTHMRDRTGDRGIVKYLRGDVADDIIDTYTHNWGDRVRETYLSTIYSIHPE